MIMIYAPTYAISYRFNKLFRKGARRDICNCEKQKTTTHRLKGDFLWILVSRFCVSSRQAHFAYLRL